MTLLYSLLLLGSSLYTANGYTLTNTYDATNFFNDDSFSWYDGWDIFNKGLVTYLPKDQAMKDNIAKITANNKVYLGLDSATKLSSTTPGPGNGRKSIRLESFQTMDNGLLIADFDHLPGGACGAWTAFWLVHDSGDGYSEIDIVENINLESQNWNNAYTNFGQCTMKNLGGTGSSQGTNCAVNGGGCHVLNPAGTFGQSFNAHQGGFWATQIESDGIKIWHFPRGTEPADINGANPDPTKWGRPVMNYGVDKCDMKSMFKKMKLTINIVTCGSWAGGAWPAGSTCAKSTGTSTCEAYVANNPAAFKDAYFLINSIRLYQNGQVSQTPSKSISSASTPTTVPTHKPAISTLSTIAVPTHKPSSSALAPVAVPTRNPTPVAPAKPASQPIRTLPWWLRWG